MTTPALPTTISTVQRRAVRGAAWTLPTSVMSRGVGLVGTLLLARYLAPAEYGVVMAASIAAMTATSVTTFGVGIYLVATETISRSEAFHATCWFLATGLVALVTMMALGGPVGRWSGAPGLVAFLPPLIVSSLLERVAYVPERILVRNLRFGWLALARAAGELIYTGLSVGLAAAGWGGMAIVWGSLARSAFRFVVIVPAVDVRDWLQPHRFRLATLVGIIKYGMSVTLASVATFGMRRWDNLLIGRYFGAGVMGAYNYAYNLADTPSTAVGDQISDVIAASFPHVDRRRRVAALVQSCSMVAMIMLPLSIGLAAVAPTVVEAFFSPEWADVGVMLVWLSALSAARPLANVLTSYFYATRRPGVVLGVEWASLAGIVAALTTVGRVSMHAACAWIGIVFVIRTVGAMWVVHRQDGVAMSEFLLPMVGPILACVAMAAGVSATRAALVEVAPPMRLAVEVAAGAAIYVGTARLIARSTCDDLVRVVRSALAPAP